MFSRTLDWERRWYKKYRENQKDFDMDCDTILIVRYKFLFITLLKIERR